MSRYISVLTILLLSCQMEAANDIKDFKQSEPAEQDKITFSDSDWPWWRGPNRNGIASSGQNIPTKWSQKDNVLWKVSIPGRGHGSPTVFGNQVFLAIADIVKGTQSVHSYNRETGKEIWTKVVHEGGFKPTSESSRKGNSKSSYASASVACDGKQIYINFLKDDTVYLSALTTEGKIVWQKPITKYVIHQGYGSSPALYGPNVIVSADNKSGGVISALNRTDGEIAWSIKRPEKPNYPSPIILKTAGYNQLLMIGCNLVSSFDPLTGKKLWEVPGATTECVTSTVTDGKIIITSGGYPDNHISAVHADGSGKLAWRIKKRVYVPSMIIHKGTLYGVTDQGIAMCWDCKTGDELWKKRLNGTFTASPVLVGEYLYAISDSGETVIFKANPEKYDEIARNTIPGQAYATPAICGNQIFFRIAEYIDDNRVESLYCIAHNKK